MNIIDKIENNSTICFFGDSITASGIWESEIFSYLAKHYKEKRLKLYNCGTSGDLAQNAIKRVYKDCLCFSPDYVVLMLGMNDIGRGLYLNDSDENVREREKLIVEYKENMNKLVDIITKSGAKVILCTPTICGYIPEGRTDVADITPALAACAEIVREIAERDGYMLIDFNTALWDYAKLEEAIITDDCVHPTEYGYHIMAQIFMVQAGIKDSVDLTPYVEENPTNIERFKIDKILVDLRFCEFAMTWHGADSYNMKIDERKNWIKEFGNTDTASYWDAERTKKYLETVDFKDEYIGKLTKYTNMMYTD